MTSGKRAVLGIDAAWGEKNPSGVALVREDANGWSCLAVAGSHREFGRNVFSRETKTLDELVQAAASDLGASLVLLTVDMPLSHRIIDKRREADNAITRNFSKNWCPCHSPQGDRPEKVSRRLYDMAKDAGFALHTTADHSAEKTLLEVYPHAALLRLLRLDKRLEYKVSRSRQLFPGASVEERKEKHLAAFQRVVGALSQKIAGIPAFLPKSHKDVKSFAALKSVEDALDALVCAWVGVEYLEGRAEPFGDGSAAIWVPKPHSLCASTW
ncbi:MAG TPA: DUF429 domain-containing protein [Dongiaceae bacterium]|nr:DUF429 domain-containing protein [Dongiaceae bacterium]